MILQYNQTRRQPHPEYEVLCKGRIIATGRGLVDDENPTIDIHGEEYSIPLDSSRKGMDDFGSPVPNVYDVVKSNQKVGTIYEGLITQKKILFVKIGYSYICLKLLGKTYYGYEIGFGEDQHYVCIKQGDVTIGIIHKTDIVVNYLDTYTIYLEKEEDLDVCILFAMYFENARYADLYEIMDSSTEDTSCLTIQKELNAHFDPTFIPRIKELET